jgi:hypothetical protein
MSEANPTFAAAGEQVVKKLAAQNLSARFHPSLATAKSFRGDGHV